MTIEIKINDILVHTISNQEVKILRDKYPSSSAGAEIAAGIIRKVNSEIRQISNSLINEWIVDGKLAENGVTTASTDRTTALNTIFAQPNYKDRDARDLESNK